MSHEVSRIKLVQIVWKKNTVKLRIGKGLRGKNKELQSEFTNIWACVNWWKMEFRFFFGSDVRKRMEIIFITYQDFKELNMSPQLSLQLWSFPVKKKQKQ